MADLSKLLAMQKAARAASTQIVEKPKVAFDLSKLSQPKPTVGEIPLVAEGPRAGDVDYMGIMNGTVPSPVAGLSTNQSTAIIEDEIRAKAIQYNGSKLAGLAKALAVKESAAVIEVATQEANSEIMDRIAESDFVEGDDELGEIYESAMSDAQFNIVEGLTVTLDESQLAAVRGLATSDMGCLIGAAGTGKTTTTRWLLNTLINGDVNAGIEPVRLSRVDMSEYSAASTDSKKKAPKEEIPTIAMVAFTGQATQVLTRNMPKAWRRNCMTIHSLLGYAPVEYTKADGSLGMRFEPSYTKENKMPWDIVCIDEASMVSVDLWHQLRNAAKDSCRFYFIGDLNQLPPPIGEGILGFALSRLPVFELTTVHRTADAAGNKIVDAAWHVLQGEPLEFDDPSTDPNWRVIGFKIDNTADKAHQEICSLALGLSQRRVHKSVDPTTPIIYDPWRDRIMVTMNGEGGGDSPAGRIGQVPLNESLSQLFAGKDVERIIINYKKGSKKFSTNYRVMATKNEPPNKVDRVTNGLTGRIVSIHPNPDWIGDWRLVGPEKQVAANRRIMVSEAMGNDGKEVFSLTAEDLGEANDFIDSVKDAAKDSSSEERQSGPASHVVEVEFDNGGKRLYNLNAQIEQLQIAYASTTHKTQGAEMPTAIIVVHHAQRMMLCRENLYTAITRAKERVVILYTDFGLRLAMATQKIRGSTLKEKIQKYIELAGEGNSSFKVMNVRLKWDD